MKLFPAFASGVLAVAVVSMTYAVKAQPGWSPKEGGAMWAGTGAFHPELDHVPQNSTTCFCFFVADGV